MPIRVGPMAKRRKTAVEKQVVLTRRERKLIKALHAGQPIPEAAKVAGYKNVQPVYRKLHPTGYGTGEGKAFRAAWLELLEKAGLSDRALVKPIREGLRAMRDRWNATTLSFEQVSDHPVRLQAAKMGLDLKGRFPTKDEGGPLVSVRIITNLTTGDDGPSPISGGFSARAMTIEQPKASDGDQEQDRIEHQGGSSGP